MTKHDDRILKYQFPGQKEGEQIQILVRKHWIIDVKIAAIFLVLGVAPLIGYIIFLIFFWSSAFELYQVVIFLVFVLYFMFSMLVTFIKWLNEELDIIIITNERVIGHDQIDFFHKQVCETNIAQVQDVKGVEKGFWGSILHYGSLEIQTAADKIGFRIQHVAKPYEIARGILDVRDKHLDKEKFEVPPLSNPNQ